MKKKFVLGLVAVMALVAVGLAATDSGIQSIDRKGSHVRIDGNGAIQIEPRTGQSTIFKSGSTVNFTGATILGLTGTSAITQSLTNGDTTHAPSGDAVFDALALKQNALTNPVVGVGSGYKIARGVATITGSGTVVTGLTTVVSITATMQADASLTNGNAVTGTIGDQAGAPAAGSVIIKVWKPTANNDTTPTASAAAVAVNWIAVGT